MPTFTQWLEAFEGGVKDNVKTLTDKALDLPEQVGLVGRGVGQRLEDAESYIEGDPESQGAFEKVMRQTLRDQVRAPRQAIDLAGGAIGGTASAIDQVINRNPDNDLAASLEGIKAGFEQGGETAKEIIEPIDVLGVGAGLGANALVRGAKLARSVPQAAKLLKGARTAEVADTALNVAEGLHGAKTIGEGDTFEGGAGSSAQLSDSRSI